MEGVREALLVATNEEMFIRIRSPTPELKMKFLLWSVRGASINEFPSHAWDVLRIHKPIIFCGG